MKFLTKLGQVFYALALIVYGIQQCYFGTFRNVFFSPYQNSLPILIVFAWIFGIYLIATGILILINHKYAKTAALLLGGIFLLLLFSTKITYNLFTEPNKIYHLGLWTTALKEFALAGGAFVVAGSFNMPVNKRLAFLETLVPFGNLFFLTTMACFGTDHLLYQEQLTSIVPAWVPDKLPWVIITGVALLGSAIAIGLGIRIRPVAILLSIMTFIWFWTVHLPYATTHMTKDRGNFPASAMDALAFSGIALLIAFTMRKQKWVEDIEKWQMETK